MSGLSWWSGLARLASGHGSRAVKYRHLAEETLGLGREELSVLAVLLLRGPQTPGELKARTERTAPLASLADVERVLDVLVEREYARRIGLFGREGSAFLACGNAAGVFSVLFTVDPLEQDV